MSHVLSNDHLFDKYRVTIKIRDKILGGVPTTEDVGKVADKLPINAPVEERQKLAEEKIIESTCTFLYDDKKGQYYLRDANIVSMLREAADVLQLGYAARQLLQHGVVVKPAKLFLGKKISAQPLRRPIHVEVRGIKQATVKINQYIEQPYIEFDIWVGKGRGKLTGRAGNKKHEPDNRLSESDVKDLLLTSMEVGLGACRAQQYGKHDVISFEVI